MNALLKKIWGEVNREKPVSGLTGDYSLIVNLFFGIVLLIIIPLIFGYIIIPLITSIIIP